ncbi:unnamed protein product, partial [Porites evermanni]
GIQHSLEFCRGFLIPGFGFQFLTVELGFLIPIVSGIPDSLSCIPDSKAKDSWFYKQNFPGFEIPRAKISQIPESGVRYMRVCKSVIDLSKGTVKKISPRLHGTDAKKRGGKPFNQYFIDQFVGFC